MLHFFRSIRQKLFFQGNASRYFGYAIGEIVLIVVGILIAVQIGDSNKEREERAEESEILAGLEREFEMYFGNYQVGELDEYSKISSSCEVILKAIKLGVWDSDNSEFDQAIQWVLMSPIGDWDGGVLESIIQSGRLELIQDKALRERLAGWGGVLKGISEHQNKDRIFVMDSLFPYLTKHGYHLSGAFGHPGAVFEQLGHSWPVDTVSMFEDKSAEQQLLSDPEFRALLEQHYWGYSFTIDLYRTFKEEAGEIFEHIKRLRAQ